MAILGALGPILAGSYGKMSPDGRSWGRLVSILEASWRRFWQSRHHLERNFGLPSGIEANTAKPTKTLRKPCFSMVLAVSGGLSGGTLGSKTDLVRHVGHLGIHVGRLLVVFGRLRRSLGASCGILGGLAASFRDLGAILGDLGAILGRSGGAGRRS